MLSFVTDFVFNWLSLLSPLLIPIGVILAMWRSLSHRGDFALTWSEKLLRVVIFVSIIVLLAILISHFVATLGPRGPIGWDETMV